jgi:hypothetical protein
MKNIQPLLKELESQLYHPTEMDLQSNSLKNGFSIYNLKIRWKN